MYRSIPPAARAAAVALIFLAPTALPAQLVVTEREHSSRTAPNGLSFSFNAVQMRPQGEFDTYMPMGYGAAFTFLAAPRYQSPIALRVDGGFVAYGSETKRVPFSNTVGSRIMVDVTTTNSIILGGIGPQLMVPRGPIRPYVAGTVGFAAFVTSSSIEGADDTYEFANTNNHSDGNLLWTGYGGVYIPMRTNSTPWSLDVSLTWNSSGRASYLREGDITDNPDGSITMRPQTSQTDWVGVRIGVRIGG